MMAIHPIAPQDFLVKPRLKPKSVTLITLSDEFGHDRADFTDYGHENE
jgi:hypothetical protein